MNLRRLPWLVASLGLVAACSSGDADETSGVSEEEALATLDNGAGAGKPVWEVDPCDNPHHYAATHNYHLVDLGPNVHMIHGTPGRDLIVGTDGDDTIEAGDGDDIVCAGYGEDKVHGGAGDDYIDGGGDNDKLWGDAGDDLIHGRGGSDEIWGGVGDDILLGDILDDHLYGEDGADLLIGGHGTDVMMGGDGNDYLRGDTGNDAFIGGRGTDVASFVTAMPPGQGQRANAPTSKVTGVKVDFSNDCSATGFTASELGKAKHDGCANGDGGNEPLDGIEVVIGSPYDDEFVSGGQARRFMGGYGDDRCDGNACGTPLPAGAAGNVLVAIDPKARDTGLLVLGSVHDDRIDVSAKGHDLVIASLTTKLVAGPGCHEAAGHVECTMDHTLRYAAAYMDDGDDVVRLGSEVKGADAFPRDFTAHVSGGEGDDWLHGGDEQDVLFTGERGRDHLYGNGGSDALLSESRKWPAMDCSKLDAAQRARNARCTEDKPDAAHYDDGRDELYGGPGDDQLVIDYPCGKHLYSGGGGKDIAGFARSGRFGIRAQMAGPASVVKAFHGRAYNPDLCGLENATYLLDDLEIFEAADGDDEIWGNDAKNLIWGREGDDHLHGLGGDDELDGLVGDDWLYGGAGNDKLVGAGGTNHLFQDAD